MSVFIDSIRGSYVPQNNHLEPDSIIALEFSRREVGKGIGQPNLELADWAMRPELAGLPLFTGETITDGLVELEAHFQPAAQFVGPSAKGVHENTGTNGELVQSYSMLQARRLSRPLILHSAWNMANVQRQMAQVFTGEWPVHPIVPPDLPRSFDPGSMLRWTQSRTKWQALTVPRLVALKLNKH